MLNSVSAISSSEALYNREKVNQVKTGEQAQTGPASSSVVELQGSNIVASSREASALGSSEAAGLAANIASLLGSHGGSVQENLNGFDAARLLAD